MSTLLVRAPSHLGDGVMALPALAALSRAGRTSVLAPAWGQALYGHLDVRVCALDAVESADVGLTFAPSISSAWALRRCRRRFGIPGERGRRVLLSRVTQTGTHRRDTYAALAEAVGAEVTGEPSLPSPDAAPVAGAPAHHIALFPATATGATVQWTGFAALARRLSERGIPVCFYAGPGELARVRQVAGTAQVLQPGCLQQLMATLQSARAVVANDSGASHLARAMARPTVVVFGSTTPEVTGASGCVSVVGPRLPCAPCYSKQCAHQLGCLRVSVAEVESALEMAWAA